MNKMQSQQAMHVEQEYSAFQNYFEQEEEQEEFNDYSQMQMYYQPQQPSSMNLSA